MAKQFKPLPPEQEAEVVRRYTKLNQPTRLIGFALGISAGRAADVLKRHNVARRTPGKAFQNAATVEVAECRARGK